jgi:hypothetical protein
VHAVHEELPFELVNVLAGHSKQSCFEVEPVLLLNVPTSQKEQDDIPCCSLNVPFGHTMTLPFTQYFPTEHGKLQFLQLLLEQSLYSYLEQYVDSGQLIHTVDPSFDVYVPSKQSVQLVAFTTLENVPIGQMVMLLPMQMYPKGQSTMSRTQSFIDTAPILLVVYMGQGCGSEFSMQ